MLSLSAGWWGWGGGGWGRLAKLKTSYLPAEQVNHGWLFFNLSIYLFLLSCPRRNWRKLCKLRNVKKLAVRNLRNVHNVHNTPCLSTELFTFPRKNLGERVQTKWSAIEVQLANKSEVSELELSLSIRCWWYSNLWLNCQTFFAFRHFSHISSCLPQIEIIKTIFELQDFLNSPVKWKILSTVKPVFNRTRKLAPSSDRAIIFAINN